MRTSRRDPPIGLSKANLLPTAWVVRLGRRLDGARRPPRRARVQCLDRRAVYIPHYDYIEACMASVVNVPGGLHRLRSAAHKTHRTKGGLIVPLLALA